MTSFAPRSNDVGLLQPNSRQCHRSDEKFDIRCGKIDPNCALLIFLLVISQLSSLESTKSEKRFTTQN